MKYSYKKSLNIIKKKKNLQNLKDSKFIIFIKIINYKKFIILKNFLIKNNLNIFFIKKKLIENNNIYIKNQNLLYSIFIKDEKSLLILYEYLKKNQLDILFISNIKNIYSNIKFIKKNQLNKKENIFFDLKFYLKKIILILNKKLKKADIT